MMNVIGNLSGGADSGAAGESDLDVKLAQVGELSTKLDMAETKITAMVNAAVPKVHITLPKLNSSAFGGNARQEPGVANGYIFRQLPLLNSEDALPTLFKRAPSASLAAAAVDMNKQASVNAGAASSVAEQKAAEMAAKAAAAARAAQEAADEMQEHASKLAAEAQEQARKRFLAPALAAVTSVAVSLTMAIMEVDQFAGALIAGLTAAALNLLGLATVWKGRAEMIFSVMSSVFDKVKTKVVDVLDTVDDMISAPLQKLEGALDKMAEEQRPAIEQMQQLESTLQKVDPDFNIPDLEDLRKPLDGCEVMINEFVEKAKKEVPEKLDELVQSTRIGRIATDEALFNRVAVLLPMAVLFAVNAVVVLLQVFATIQGAAESEVEAAPPASSTPLPDTAGNAVTNRRLRGGIDASSAAPLSETDFWPYLQPTVMQIALCLLQQLAMLAFSQGPRICGAVNSAVSSLEMKVNERINVRVQGAVDRVFGTAFGEVKSQTQVFFPKFKGALCQLEEAIKLAGQAEAAMQAASEATQMFKKMW